jgi:CHASE3 domain sensor protein
MNAKDKKQRGLVDRLRSSLVLTMILFVGMLILCLAAGIYSSINQYNLGEQKVTIYDDIDGILNSVLDQSSTLRTYINTDNPASLGPFNSSHSQYLAFVQHLKSQTNSGDFRVTPVAIELVEERADNWYNNYAQLEIRNMQSGNFAAARSSDTITLRTYPNRKCKNGVFQNVCTENACHSEDQEMSSSQDV